MTFDESGDEWTVRFDCVSKIPRVVEDESRERFADTFAEA